MFLSYLPFSVLALSLVLIAPFDRFVLADPSVVLHSPPPGKAGTPLSYEAGNKIQVTFEASTFFTLQARQGPDEDGTESILDLLSKSAKFQYAYKALTWVIIANETSSTTDYHWPLQNLGSFTSDFPLFFRLFIFEDWQCETCHTRSVNFTVTNDSSASSTYSSATVSPTMSRTASAHKSESSLKVGLGVGIGLGVPLIVTITGSTTWLCLRRRRRGRQLEEIIAYQVEPEKSWNQQSQSISDPVISPPSVEYVSSSEQKTPENELASSEIAELNPNSMLLEADRDAERVELEGDAGDRVTGRKLP